MVLPNVLWNKCAFVKYKNSFTCAEFLMMPSQPQRKGNLGRKKSSRGLKPGSPAK